MATDRYDPTGSNPDAIAQKETRPGNPGNEMEQAASLVRNDAPDLTARRVSTRRLPDFIAFENGLYRCAACGAKAEELAALTHAPDCPHGA